MSLLGRAFGSMMEALSRGASLRKTSPPTQPQKYHITNSVDHITNNVIPFFVDQLDDEVSGHFYLAEKSARTY